MSKRKQNQEVHQPDDKLFKTVMQEKENAAEYLKTYYPELAKSLELSTLEILREKFSIPNMKIFDADISYRCQFKDSEEKLMLNFLWENKSKPEKYIAIQVGLYLFLRYYQMVKTTGQKLEPVMPLVFYNGKEDWIPQTMSQLFENHPFYELFKKAIPNFEFHFTDVKKIPHEQLLAIELAFFRSAMIAMANKHDSNLLFQYFSVIFDIDDRDNAITIGYYVFAWYEKLPEEVKKNIRQFAHKVQINIMSTLAAMKQEGKVEGMEEERKKRMEEKKKRLERDIRVVRSMNKKGIPTSEIAEILEVEEAFVLAAIQSEKK